MLAPPGDLLRAGFELKLNRVKRATQSYMRDRTQQATGTVTSYAVAVGLFAAAGVFLVAACLVGLTALFRWVELKYGLFPAFGVLGGVLVLLTIVCAGVAILRLKRRPPEFPSLASRLRVAVAAPAFKTPTSGGFEPSTTPPASAISGRLRKSPAALSVSVGLGAAAMILGVVAARRRQQTRR